MSNLQLALSYLRSRLLITILTVTSVALGLALATIVYILSQQTQEMLNTGAAGCDFVVGAKGSPLQLVLNSLYYLDAPTGVFNISVWQHLQNDPEVERTIPLTLGDNYYGYPIVGTVPDFFVGHSALNGKDLLTSGRMFNKQFETVVGSQIAAQFHLRLGQTMIGAHGWAKSNDFHAAFPYTIAGLLAPTGTNIDRAVYTDYHSIWTIHAHPDADDAPDPNAPDPTHEITALLVQLHHPASKYRMIQEINANENAMAADPPKQIQLISQAFIDPLQKVLLLVAYLVVLVSTLSILISLYLTINQRKRDVAIMRSLGATRTDIFFLITLEAAALAGIGVIAGWLVGHGLLALASSTISAQFGIIITAWHVQPVEILIACSVWILGILAGLLPAAMAYRLSVADTLVRE
jgi:putative ABC transport system permease protein